MNMEIKETCDSTAYKLDSLIDYLGKEDRLSLLDDDELSCLEALLVTVRAFAQVLVPRVRKVAMERTKITILR